jgi:hypothetical protein
MGCCCRHDSVISMANIYKSGEKQSLPLALLQKVFSSIEPERQVGILYDIGCSLDKFCRLVSQLNHDVQCCIRYIMMMAGIFLFCS